MLEYSLELNELTKEPDDMRAKTVNVISRNQSEIIDRMMQSGAGLTRSDVLSVLEAEKEAIYAALADGEAVTTDLFNAFPSVQGVFTGANDSFDPKRHRVKIHLHEGAGLRKVEVRVKTKKVQPGQTGAFIASVTDMKTGSVNNLLTPGRPLRMYGSKLKVVGDDESVGVYFLGADGSAVKVDASDIVENKPADVMVMIPELAAGTYYVRVITQFAGSGRLAKKPHIADFGAVLTAPADGA
ncbi:MAG: DUF4469 domain-containing protein [Treponema sp.]|jgi:hypothetical protein|nr:DUF4469 domain-containing protein [Treponema sp.]